METDKKAAELTDNELDYVTGGSIDWVGLKFYLKRVNARSIPELTKLIACIEAKDEKSATAEAWRLIQGGVQSVKIAADYFDFTGYR